MKTLLKYSALPIIFALSACTDTEFSDHSSGWLSNETQILSNPRVFADGFTKLTLKLRLFNRKGSGRHGVKLRSLDSYGAVIFKGCTESDESGIADCNFVSAKPGRTTIEVFDDFGRISAELVFIEPRDPVRLTKVVPSKQLKQSEDGYTLQTKIQKIQGLKLTQSGYKINTFKISPQNQ